MADNPDGTGDFDPPDDAERPDDGSTDDDADVDEAVEADDGADVDPTGGTDADAGQESTDSGDADDTEETVADAEDADAGVGSGEADADAEAASTDVEPEDSGAATEELAADAENTEEGDAAEEDDVDAAVDAAGDVDGDASDDELSDIGHAELPPPEDPEERPPDESADEHEFTLDSDAGPEFREATAGDPEFDEEESESPVIGGVDLDDTNLNEEREARGGTADEGLFGDGPESDEEMPLAEHLEEMVGRLGVVLFVGGVVTLTLFPGSDVVNAILGTNYLTAVDVINYLWNAHIPGAPELPDRRPRLYGPLELILTELKVAALAGFVLGLPILVYQTYRFMRPGLYAHERRYYLAAIPTSLILATVGVLFSHFVVLPLIFQYFTSYTTGTAVVAFGLRETFNLILLLMGYNALIFQIPLFIMLAIMMGLTTRTWMEDRRLLFWGAFAGIAFLINPDPTGMAPIIIVVTMITLFEGTLLLLRWTGN